MYSKELTVAEMIQIENHIATGDCLKVHHSLKDLATKVDSSDTNTTPLVMACYLGQLIVVQRMIEVWGAEIESRSFLSITGEIASKMGLNNQSPGLIDVTPLFAAALNNRTDFVRYLVGKRADVSARTSTRNPDQFGGLTSLHGALLHDASRNHSDQLDIIRILLDAGADPSALSLDGTPPWMFGCLSFYKNHIIFLFKGFCNIQAITLLIEHGMSIEQRCPKLDGTLLHHMAGPANNSDDVKIIELLLEKGVDHQVRDKHGLTPIMTAAIGSNVYPNMSILKFFMERDEISNMDKIEALEVATAVLLSYDRNFQMSIDPVRDINYCLSQSQSLRNIEGITLIPKTPSNGRAVEWATSSDFQNILQRPLELEMQSILIRLRIFSTMSWGSVYRYLCPFVLKIYCRNLTVKQKYAQLLDISWAMLETIRLFAPSADKCEVFCVAVKVVEALVNTLADLKRNVDPLFNVETLKTSFKLVSSIFPSLFFRYDSGRICCDTWILRKMISILVGQSDVIIQPIAAYLSDIVFRNNKASDQVKLILVACMEQTENTADLVRFLLKFGALPDVIDSAGNGPLHTLARSNGEFTYSIARVLLDAGAHLDRINKEGLTAADVWIEKRERENYRRRRRDQQPGGWRKLPDWLREDVPKLLCLSARIISSRRIYYKDVVPVTLHPFVAMH